MKKYLLFIGCIYSFACFSQNLNKGDKLFGGSFTFSASNYTTDAFNSGGGSNTGIAPTFSWLIKNNLAMGIRGGIGYSTNWAENQAGQKDKNAIISSGVSVFLRKYKSIKEKFGYYLDNDLGINFYSDRQESGSSGTILKNNTKGIGYRFSPGVYYKFSDNFLGEANIGGAYASYRKNKGGSKSFGAGVSFLQYFNLGINYRINSKSKG